MESQKRTLLSDGRTEASDCVKNKVSLAGFYFLKRGEGENSDNVFSKANTQLSEVIYLEKLECISGYSF
jgi:hypothetical protein